MTTFFHHEHRYRDLSPVAERLVTICGAGALGANLAETLARMGLRHLRVIDRDRVEAHNLSTQPWIQQDIGAAKVRVLAGALYRAVGARVDPRHAELTPANAAGLLAGSAVVVDAFDNLPARTAVARAAASQAAACLHIALGGAGDYGCGLWDSAYGLNDEGGTINDEAPASVNASLIVDRSLFPDGCDYPLTRPLVLLVVAAAAEALVGYLIEGRRRGFEVTLRDLRLATT